MLANGVILSRIRFVVFRPTATRGRLSIILTLTPHRLLHVTQDYSSHHPLHCLHTHSWMHWFTFTFAFSRRFYPKRLTVHSGYYIYLFFISMFFYQYVSAVYDFTYTAESNQARFISLGLPLSHCRVLFSVYHIMIKYDHITPIIQSLHWLPIKYRISYKILLLTYKALNGLAPAYLTSLLSRYNPTRSLRSQNSGLLVVPRIAKST